MHAFLDATKPLTTNYGAVVGLSALGAQVCVALLLLFVVVVLLCVSRCGHMYRPAIKSAILSPGSRNLELAKGAT